MFTTLVESRAVRHRSVSGTITSVTLHAAGIGLAVALSVTGVRATEAPPKEHPLVYTTVHPREVAPAHTTQRQPSGPAVPSAPAHVVIAPVKVPNGLPPIDLTIKTGNDEPVIITRGGVPSGGIITGPAVVGNGGDPVDEHLVERVPSVLGGSPAPRYPSMLREVGISGKVVMRFVIDTLGRAEMDGATVLDATHPLFVDAVKNVLPMYRFSPGEVGGRKVRTLVQMPFAFTLR